MKDQSQSEYTYYAFISYKREDEKWAKWLQKKLESYGFPVALRKENPKLPSKIRPIFRDQSELSGGNLNEEIEKGLADSKYLIVICSPRSAQSPWVSKEVQYFIDNGREKNIIPFIIGGTPNAKDPEEECFPEGLRQLSGEKEILGININEMGRDAAAIKVIARMFGLRFDTLWQRHERDKRRKLLRLGIAGITLVIGSLIIMGIMSSLRDRAVDAEKIAVQQRDSIYSAYQQLREENLTAFNRSINPNLYKYIGDLRVESDGFPEAVAFSPKEPLIAYADERGYWLHNTKTNVEQELKVNYGDLYLHLEGCGMEFSKDGSELLASYHNGLLIWEIASGKLKLSIPRDKEDEFYRSDDYVERFDDSDSNFGGEKFYDGIKHVRDLNIYLRYQNGSIEILNPRKDIICSTKFLLDPITNSWVLQRIPNQKELFIIGDDKAAIYDARIKAFTQFFKGYPDDKFFFSNDGRYLCAGNEIYVRKLEVDTIRGLRHSLHPKSSFPDHLSEKKLAGLVVTAGEEDNTIRLKINGKNLKIEVLNHYKLGNGMPKLQDAVLCGKDYVVAIIADGYHKIYNLNGEYIGYLEYPYWMYEGLGGECGYHGCVDVVLAHYMQDRLYLISAGGVLRIYNLPMQSIEKVIELPRRGNRHKAIEKVVFSDDQSHLYYYFHDEDQYYEIEVP